MVVTHLSSPENEHRVLVSFAKGDADELLYLRYTCNDPTCDWCVVEFGPDDCNSVVSIVDELLTHEFYNGKNHEGGSDARHSSLGRSDQPSLFADSNQGVVR